MKKILLIILGIFITSSGYCQGTQQLIDQVAKAYTESDGINSGLIGGFSLWGLLGGIIFSSIGFIAFVYGKKNVEFRTMFMGIALMAYPYFLRGTIVLYLVGIGLTAALYFYRE